MNAGSTNKWTLFAIIVLLLTILITIIILYTSSDNNNNIDSAYCFCLLWFILIVKMVKKDNLTNKRTKYNFTNDINNYFL